MSVLRDLLQLLRNLTDPAWLGAWSGAVLYPLLFAIVFAETGLLVGFFLPGDSLLFTAGLLCGTGHIDIFVLNALLIVAAVSGDTVGYWIGYRAGPKLFTREQSLLFRRDYLEKARVFYERHGPKTIVIARFVPIIRTFAPVVAGIGRMSYARFVTYNVAGGIGWVVSMTVAGYTLGRYVWVRENLEKVIIVIVLLSISPGIVEMLRARARARADRADRAAGGPAPAPEERPAVTSAADAERRA
jgi:membrane-associated protein